MRDPGAEPRLVVPEGLVIDESARERLERQLALAPAGVAGIAAEIAELAPGASYRVHAEWTALDAARRARGPRRRRPIRGAVLLRPQVEFAVRDGAVEVANGSVARRSRRARARPVTAPIGALAAASERGPAAVPAPAGRGVPRAASRSRATPTGCAGS